MPRTAPLLAAVLVLLAHSIAQAAPEIVVMMRDHAGRDSDLDARPLEGAELELLERIAGIGLEPVRLERNGAQVLAPSGPIDPEALQNVLADLRALPDV